MGLTMMRGFEMQDTASRIRSELPRWKKAKYKTARTAGRGLFEFLEKALDGYPIQKNFFISEHGGGGPKVDFAVGHQVIVEPFWGLASKPALTKITGRLEALKKWKGVILVVLMGRVGPVFRSKLDDYVNRVNNDSEFMSVREIIVTRI